MAATMLMTVSGCDRGARGTAEARGRQSGAIPRVVINEVLANPRATPDEQGEWLELLNLEGRTIDLRGWTIASENDRAVTIPSGTIPPNGYLVLARDASASRNGGVAGAVAYESTLALANGADWVALRLPDGRTVDSVSWSSTIAGASRGVRDAGQPHADVLGANWATSTSRFGGGDAGTPGRPNDGAREPTVVAEGTVAPAPAEPRGAGERVTPQQGAGAAAGAVAGPARLDSGPPPRDSTLIVRVLDVGQGDAIYIENGGSRVLIDGGPDPDRFARHLDRLGLDGQTIDVVVLTHQHYDHYAGFRELFRSRRRIRVRYLFENKDPYSHGALASLRDSILARLRRGALVYRDSDDPCGNGAPTCTVTMRGGARLHILRPDPRGDGPNNRSTVVKLTAADSTAFTMWLAGDAERPAISWFDDTDYDRRPGMRAPVLKVNHHGSCDGISARYLDLVRPEIAVISLAANNDYGYVHTQTLDLLRARGIPWYRTDQNGTITIRAGSSSGRGGSKGYAVSVERGGPSMRGPRDRISTQEDCRER